MKIRLRGTEQECAAVSGRLGQVLSVVSVSHAYPDHDVPGRVRVYVDARLDPLSGAGPGDGGPPGEVGAPCERPRGQGVKGHAG